MNYFLNAHYYIICCIYYNKFYENISFIAFLDNVLKF